MARRLNSDNYELIDTASKEVVAVWLENKWKGLAEEREVENFQGSRGAGGRETAVETPDLSEYGGAVGEGEEEKEEKA